MGCKVVLVEDEEIQRELLSDILKEKGYSVSSFSTAERALKEVVSTSPHVLITDVRLPGKDGLTLLREVKELSPETEVILITAFSEVEDAVGALKAGAFHYLTKPFNPEVLLSLIEKACQLSKLKRASFSQKREIVYASKAMEEVLKKASLFSKSSAPVLITGESGTGKELLARFIHEKSGRKGKFVAVNCSAVPKELFESEFFGYEKGAFTGALKSKAGLVEEADGGTLFLDEVGELPLELQSKLLRFLQEGEVRRVGSTKSRKVDVRVIGATNRPLEELVREGKFREDLFYRLNVLRLTLPPLRERREDVVELVGHFLKKFSKTYGKRVEITPEAIELLLSYDFPGNVRELENLIHRAVIVSNGRITPREIEVKPKERELPFNYDFSLPLPQYLSEIEKKAIEEALKRAGFVQTKAAELLGIDEKSLRYKRKKYGI
ncbi:sigma-54-dependent transcriptional regulator [Thermovibrio sp.]